MLILIILDILSRSLASLQQKFEQIQEEYNSFKEKAKITEEQLTKQLNQLKDQEQKSEQEYFKSLQELEQKNHSSLSRSASENFIEPEKPKEVLPVATFTPTSNSFFQTANFERLQSLLKQRESEIAVLHTQISTLEKSKGFFLLPSRK